MQSTYFSWCDGKKMALLILPKGWHRVSGQKQMCHLCGGDLFLFCLYAAKFLLSFYRLIRSFYNERQRSAYMIRCGLRVASLSKSTEADAGNNADYQHRNRT